ncbi:endo-1,4-beta-xylanase [Psychrosphaera sp. 1_MG-2023]|nr:endo-1,4-beta-xylanase [Psychrosphaera sp. 1_MG-2023]MDO6718658.1 endo-1,4-beta-xylanase [Psychrosphaera sp. 1_MG-2023]
MLKLAQIPSNRFIISTLASVLLMGCSPAITNVPNESQVLKSNVFSIDSVPPLKSLVDFPVGVAVPADPYAHSLLISSERQEVVETHFNSLTAENIMKMMFLQPEPNKFAFTHADALVEYAHQKNMIMHGHALVWHTQSPKWMNDYQGSKDDFKALLKNHISTVAGHFAGKLASWDVVNEAFLDDGTASNPTKYRETIWYNNIGPEYLEMAFRLAREADSEVDLYYNDYNLVNNDSKIDRVVKMLEDFQQRNVPIDGIGFQVHIDTDTPSIKNIKEAFSKVVKRGVKVRVSELDIAVNQSEQYSELTEEVSTLQRQRYAEVVDAYMDVVPEHLRGGITLWGISDSDSWIPGFRKRADWPLLFNEKFQNKPALVGMAEGLTGQTPNPKTVEFDWFEYQGMDEIFSEPMPEGQYQNPVISGFFPDPSITRKGDDYYIAVSSFAYNPGVPILHSRDLVNWKLVGHALTNQKQLDLRGNQVSQGVYAPTIRYHDGLFYMITTAVYGGGNFFVTAEDPAGEWSEPYWLPEIGGIDPDIFFDDDGKVYIAHNDAPVGEPLYEGHRAIWMWEYDLAAKKVIKDSGRVIVNGGVDLAKQPIWIEAPHIYKIDGWYYLMCAEGGTADQHSEVVFRAKNINDPFIPYSGNPILTQRDLADDRINPITTAGHADLVQTPQGDWWAIFLATRAYDQRFYNTGRESFLLPVTWNNGWPHILEQGKAIPHRLPKPAINNSLDIDEKQTGNFIWRDEFDGQKLNVNWNTLRSFYSGWYELADGKMNITPAPIDLTSLKQPVFLSRRQQHMTYQVTTGLALPQSTDISAGLVAFQNEFYHYYLGVKKIGDGKFQLFLERTKDKNASEPRKIIKQVEISAKNDQQLVLEISGDKADISFAYQIADGEKITLAANLDGKILSTAIAQGFVGTMLGIHSRIESTDK